MGLKSNIAAWAIGKGISEYLKKFGVQKVKRIRVVEAVKKMVKPRREPVLYGGAIGVAVAIAGAFGLDLTTEQLAVTISTVIAVVSFVQRRFVSPTE